MPHEDEWLDGEPLKRTEPMIGWSGREYTHEEFAALMASRSAPRKKEPTVALTPSLSERQCYEIIQRLISFPCSQVCVNYAACWVIEQMEKSGMEIDGKFSAAVVAAHDDDALAYLQQKLG